jgi:hypothetical protein
MTAITLILSRYLKTLDKFSDFSIERQGEIIKLLSKAYCTSSELIPFCCKFSIISLSTFEFTASLFKQKWISSFFSS